MDENKLIQYARQGDLDAFNRLVEIHQEAAFNVAYRLTGDAASAEDVTQDAFISAYRSLARYRGGSFRAWLLRIVTNAGLDELRRRKRRPTTALEPEGAEGEEVESPAWLEDPGETPEEAALRGELNAAIQRCLDGLDPDFRLVVVLVDIEGLDYQEAAASARAPLGTVKSRLARARLRMQDCLRGFGELLPAGYRLENEGSL
ncbi:MAG: sigma-70 family RNA polymerase sigma factor [Chloroflexi bacterium]|nr:sigma-70 family RNA polymerase sigma factor [Chloroflexota bacterium]